MYDEYREAQFAARLSGLRTQRNISARKMSLDLGQNDSYINRIENGKALPSMRLFFALCAYLHVTPSAFFDEENAAPMRIREIEDELLRLEPQQLEAVLNLVRNMK